MTESPHIGRNGLRSRPHNANLNAGRRGMVVKENSKEGSVSLHYPGKARTTSNRGRFRANHGQLRPHYLPAPGGRLAARELVRRPHFPGGLLVHEKRV